MKVAFIALAVVFCFVVLDYLKNRRGLCGDDRQAPFYAKKLMSAAEQILYFRLVEAVPECVVLAQVQLSRVLGVKKGYRFNEWNNRINRMSLDFVVCLKNSSVLVVIELDDKTHSRPDRVSADAKKDRFLHAAGVPIIRWQARSIPDVASIRAAVLSYRLDQNEWVAVLM